MSAGSENESSNRVEHPKKSRPLFLRLASDLIGEVKSHVVNFSVLSALSIFSVLGTALWLVYETYLEPSISRRVAKMITTDAYFEDGKNPLLRFIADGIIKEVGTNGGMHADSVQSGYLKVRFKEDKLTADSVIRWDFDALVNRGQHVKLILLNKRLDIFNKDGREQIITNSISDGLSVVYQCECFRTEGRQIKNDVLTDESEPHELDVTNDIRWSESAKFKLVHVSITVEPKRANLKYAFSSNVVLLVYNALGKNQDDKKVQLR